MMGVSYQRLFKLMIDREMKKKDLLRLMILQIILRQPLYWNIRKFSLPS